MQHFGYKLLSLDEIDSTNEFAKRLILQEPLDQNCIVTANYQTRGKGRLGRTWESPRNEGLWMSLIPSTPVDHDQLVLYNLATACSVCESLRKMTGAGFELKWPNDVLIRSKKVCGMLLETVSKAGNLYLIIGIGVNLNQKEFPEPLNSTATSLRLETGKNWEPLPVMEEIVSNLNENLKLQVSDNLKKWKTLSGMLGKRIRIIQNGESFDSVAIDVAEDGALIVQDNGSVKKLYAGDVQIRLS